MTRFGKLLILMTLLFIPLIIATATAQNVTEHTTPAYAQNIITSMLGVMELVKQCP